MSAVVKTALSSTQTRILGTTSVLPLALMQMLSQPSRWHSQNSPPASKPAPVGLKKPVACSCTVVQDHGGELLRRRQVLGAVLASSFAMPASCSANSARGEAQVELEVRV